MFISSPSISRTFLHLPPSSLTITAITLSARRLLLPFLLLCFLL